MDKLQFQKLNQIFLPEKGWQPVDLAILSYSVGSSALNEVVNLSGISRTYYINMETELPQHIWVAMQNGRWSDQEIEQGHYYTRLLLKKERILSVNETRTFHPKLIAILYKKNEEMLLKLFVSSRNLTTEKNREAGILLKTTCFAQDKKNQQLSNIFEIAFKEKVEEWKKTDIAKCISEADFSIEYPQDKIEFLIPNSQQEGYLYKKIVECFNGAEEVVVVSPFLKDSKYISELLNGVNEQNYLLLTSRKIIDEVRGSFKGRIKCYPQSNEISGDEKAEGNEMEGVEPNMLHAKMYACKKKNGEKQEKHLFIGSANFSKNGLEKNHELMVHVVGDTDFCELLRNEELCEEFESVETTDMPEGNNLPKADDIEDVKTLCEKIKSESNNNLLRQFYYSVFECSNSISNAMDYVLEALKKNPDVEEIKKWKANMEKSMITLPEELEGHESVLRGLLDQMCEVLN